MVSKPRTSSQVNQIQMFKKPILFLLLIFKFLTLTKSNHESSRMSDYCSIQVCSYREPISRYVQFPFKIKNESLPSFCGYPGFDLFCNEDYRLLINLPNFGSFSVEEIDYIKQELWLNDPNNCLPRKLLSINGSSFVGNKSHFHPLMEHDLWLFNCSNEFFDSSSHSPIECLSGTNYGVFGTSLEKIYEGNSSMCRKIGPIKVPKGAYKEDSSSILRGDIRVSWSKPRECGVCYEKGGRCVFKSNSNLEVECLFPNHGLTRNAVVAIALAFAAPLAMCIFAIIYFLLRSKTAANRHGGRRRHGVAGPTTQAAVTPQPQEVVAHGLDHDTIESYPKVVLGESRRLPKPDDMNCPICLGEYLAKESLRTIPDCGHCFHADCVDAWLHLNASCPICRKSPSNNNKPPELFHA